LQKKEIAEFLLQTCKVRGLSLRSLSINAGLSPGAVHSIIKREYEPTLYSLNRLADYLSVKRQYLWQLAGLLPDMDYDDETTFSDPQLRFHFSQADRLPNPARMLIISIIKALITYIDGGGHVFKHGRTFSLSGDNKGLICPFHLVDCDEGYCQQCQKYHDWKQTV